MLDIGWSELLVIGVVALVVIGPKELPTVLRKVGQGVSKLRRMAGDFQGQFNEALREAELSEFKDNITGLKNDLGNLAADAHKSIANAIPTNPLHDIEDSLKAPTSPVERKDLAPDAAEGLPPEPSELEPNAFESIEDEVRAAAAHLPEATTPAPVIAPPVPALAVSPPAVAEAKPADGKPVDVKPAEIKPASVTPPSAIADAPADEKSRRAPRRKVVAPVEVEGVQTAFALGDASLVDASSGAPTEAAKPVARSNRVASKTSTTTADPVADPAVDPAAKPALTRARAKPVLPAAESAPASSATQGDAVKPAKARVGQPRVAPSRVAESRVTEPGEATPVGRDTTGNEEPQV
ncbi:Sec-independent protein translocase protein TatB [Ancylobacter amanitiformis]|uniref:Sec-independent protein translocase protein TatB n=1 Tax=Ancylobacter amanitiformis TaxID=217069 RepID=A0ABU0LUC2_9HYPH|nr:Sec-independent protein translocase protein TatB [Ancylobacter amanitiformis]MDQ0512306.1 sec-independent protein translocase protein TatB [Ancylobacter amanitiformis]